MTLTLKNPISARTVRKRFVQLSPGVNKSGKHFENWKIVSVPLKLMTARPNAD